MKNLFLLSYLLLSLFLIDSQAQLPPDSKFKSNDEVIQAVSQAMGKQSFLKITTRKKEKDKMGNIIFGKKQTWWGNITLLKGDDFLLADNCFWCDGYYLKLDEVISIKQRPKLLRTLRNKGEIAMLISMMPAIAVFSLTEKIRTKIKHKGGHP